MEGKFEYRPACASEQPGGCANCTMAYDCRSKGARVPFMIWPLFGLAFASLLALVA